MPFRFTEKTTESGARYLRVDAEGRVALDVWDAVRPLGDDERRSGSHPRVLVFNVELPTARLVLAVMHPIPKGHRLHRHDRR